MKNLYLLLLLLPFTMSAQLSVGLKSGICISELSGNNKNDFGFGGRVGYYTGLSLKLPITESLSLQPEINFSPQGGKRYGIQKIFEDKLIPGNSDLYANAAQTLKTNYLELPVMFRVDFGSSHEFFAAAGPFIGMLLDAQLSTQSSGIFYSDPLATVPFLNEGKPLEAGLYDNTINYRENINDFNFGFQLYFGMQYPLGPGKVFLENRYMLGLIDIVDSHEDNNLNITRSMCTSLGYSLNINSN